MTQGEIEKHVAGPAEGEDKGTSEEEQAVSPEEFLLEGLLILPPRQKTSVDKVQHAVALPPLRGEEPVQSLRGALAEVIGYAHMTNFRFEVCDKPENVTTGNLPLISPYSGTSAVIATPLAAESLSEEKAKISENYLDEYGNLIKLVERKNPASFEIVLERYDVASIKDHVIRLRSLMQGNAPSVESLVDEDDEEKEEEASGEKKDVPETVGDLPLNPIQLVTGNLQDYFYRVNGEDPESYLPGNKIKQTSNSSKKKKKKNGGEEVPSKEIAFAKKVKRWNELDDKTKMPYAIRYSGFHPPPSSRRWLGDLAYLELVDLDQGASLNGSSTCISVTATPTGFYVNNSKPSQHFDPSPSKLPCFSHSLLDCLLQASPKFNQAWAAAVDAAKERSAVLKDLNKDPLLSFFRVATRADFGGFTLPNSSFQQALDGALVTPSWIVPKIPVGTWHDHQLHPYNIVKSEEDLSQTYGLDLRNGGIRDWNEELQMAREMVTETLPQRIERARLLHKVLTEFGEASLLGVKAIVDGYIAPMNPNETARAQVFLHNNIFFSRAIDAGPETFKWHKGDAAARKAANRDLAVISTISRTEKSGLCTLATVLIDFLGTRYVCQSILPGILIGEKSHTLLYGAVETGSPLRFDAELHDTMKKFIGEGMMLASRPVYRVPITSERLDEVQKLREKSPFYPELEKKLEEEKIDANDTIETCIPIEAKGIMGSDKRKYLLDFGRLTPRDANWVPASDGGTGKFEGLKVTANVPPTLEDDEWTMHVLRPELLTRFTQTKMSTYFQSKKEAADGENKKTDDEVQQEERESSKLSESERQDTTDATEVKNVSVDSTSKAGEKETTDRSHLSEEDKAYVETLKLNVNVFMPHMKKYEGELAEQIKADEQQVRDAAEFLWDDVLPRITRGVKDGSLHPLPMDGKTLTEFIHRHGINCRYLGRIASLAREEEARDEQTEAELKKGTLAFVERRLMPKCWLELLECEIVARAAKHVLDRYLRENAGIASLQPSQTIASFLSALVSEREESAAQTETRLEKRTSGPDEDEFNALTFTNAGGDSGGDSSLIRGRFEVWNDIEAEVGRRFRYALSLYNKGNKSGRALHVTLLRRICQRAGIRLYAKNYDVGNRCLCGGGNTVTGVLLESYPISPLDIVDIVPLMKHSSSYNEGFEPCNVGATISLPPLQVALTDARLALQRAHIMISSRALGKGLELAQEAASLYQRVTESATHPGVVESMELMSNVFLEAGDAEMACLNEAKALMLSIQGSGFDAPRVFTSHMSLFQMHYAAKRTEQAIKHANAALYILELMAGPRHTEVFSIYHKLGSIYSSDELKGKYNSIALAMLEEAEKRGSCDRLMDGIAAKSHAKVHVSLKNFGAAVEAEKKSYQVFSMFLGRDHQLSKESEVDLMNYSKMAAKTNNGKVSGEQIREQEALADAVAAELVAEEEKKMNKGSKKKKGKK